MGIRTAAVIVGVLLASASGLAQALPAPTSMMSFFLTSKGRGLGGNLGGIRGADALCRQLADTVGMGQRTWRAYLSAPATSDQPAVDARDRIGRGPWFNARGVMIAAGITELHEGPNELGSTNTLTEKGTMVAPGRHDVLTGSNPDGTLASNRGGDTTCNGWTSLSTGRAMLGHHNRTGGGERPTSWNSAHLSRGCSQSELRASFGDGLIYCFAAD
jgi:hypothetical protein